MNNIKKELFFPYYINQGRLLDIYSILNNGYSDYEELTQEKSKESKKDENLNTSASVGFKLLKISGGISAEDVDTQCNSNKTTIKKVQTITSILSMVLSELKSKKYICELDKSKSGNFIVVPVNLQINSLKNILDELIEIMELIGDVGKLGVDAKINTAELNNYKKIAKSLKSFVNSEEIVSETNDYAITGNICQEHFYQGTKMDIINTEIMCLAQVKKVFPNGTELMKNNKLGLFKDATIKDSLIECVESFNANDQISFTSTAVSEIKNKPVYQVEIIALYQTENMA